MAAIQRGVGALGLAATMAWAGSIDNRNNNSVEYIRSLSRNAAIDAGDASIYNPAGTVRLPGGLTLDVSNQSIAKFNTHATEGPGPSYRSAVFSPLYPTAFAVYRRDDWSGFAAFSFPGGGGELDYQHGSAAASVPELFLSHRPMPADADVYLRSIYGGATLGGAYAPLPWLSVSAAGRYLYGQTVARVKVNGPWPAGLPSQLVDHEEDAQGVAPVFGVDLFPAPLPALTLGLRYEGITKLDWKVEKSNLNLDSAVNDPAYRANYITNLRQVLRAPGTHFHRDLPAVLGLGAGYQWLPALRTDLSFNYYFNTWADWGGAEDKVDDGWETAVSAEYAWPIPLRTSVGLEYTVTGAGPAGYSSPENPALDSYSLALGARYDFSPRLALDAGVTGNIGFDDSMPFAPLSTTFKLEKQAWVYALGLKYHL